MPGKKVVVALERIESQILLIRGQKVMLSTHLAKLYEVETRALIQAVKRNIDRFPEDFMFQLTAEESANLKVQSVILNETDAAASRSQSVILKRGQNIKYPPYAFTEQGVAMLSSVLRSPSQRKSAPSDSRREIGNDRAHIRSRRAATRSWIQSIRGLQVLLDKDLAAIYGVPTKIFNQAIKRNLDRFPEDFRFQLSPDELANLRSQSVTSSLEHGGRRYLPWAFTEHGAIMAASVLSSPRAVEMSVFVVRAFVHLRDFARTHAELGKQLAALEFRVA